MSNRLREEATMAGTLRSSRRMAGSAAAARLAGLLAVLLLAACSPEDGRARGGLGADVGNTALPVELRGNQDRNNPSFQTPEVGLVPQDAKGVPGWWVSSGN